MTRRRSKHSRRSAHEQATVAPREPRGSPRWHQRGTFCMHPDGVISLYQSSKDRWAEHAPKLTQEAPSDASQTATRVSHAPLLCDLAFRGAIMALIRPSRNPRSPHDRPEMVARSPAMGPGRGVLYAFQLCDLSLPISEGEAARSFPQTHPRSAPRHFKTATRASCAPLLDDLAFPGAQMARRWPERGRAYAQDRPETAPR